MSGVRISPPAVDFYDTVANTAEQLNITVKNISKGSKSIRFYGPKTKVTVLYAFNISHNCIKKMKN